MPQRNPEGASAAHEGSGALPCRSSCAVFGSCSGPVFFLAAVAARAFDSLPALVVEMRSTTNGTAQLFYDPGPGLDEDHSVRAPVAATGTFQTLWFRLPADSIRALRFDPIDRPGTFTVRRTYVVDSFGSVVREFTAADIVPLNQIASRADSASGMTFTTPADAFDPILQLALPQPLYPAGSSVKRAARFAMQLLLALLVTAVVAAAALAPAMVVGAGRSPAGSAGQPWSAIPRSSSSTASRSAVTWASWRCSRSPCRPAFTDRRCLCTRLRRPEIRRACDPIVGTRKANPRRTNGTYHTPAILQPGLPRPRRWSVEDERPRSGLRVSDRQHSGAGTSPQCSGRSSGASSFCRRPMDLRSTGSSRRCCFRLASFRCCSS